MQTLALRNLCSLAACLAGFAYSTTAVRAEASAFTPAQRTELMLRIRDYIRKNPDVVRNALKEFLLQETAAQAKEKKKKDQVNIRKHAQSLFQDPSIPSWGPDNANRTFVLFIDPYCGYCAQSLEDMENLASEKNTKVFVRYIGLLGPESEQAAIALLAARKMGQYMPFLKTLKKAGALLSQQELLDTAKSLGLDTTTFLKQMNSLAIQTAYKKNVDLASTLNIEGTPTLVIEDQIIEGYTPPDKIPRAQSTP